MTEVLAGPVGIVLACKAKKAAEARTQNLHSPQQRQVILYLSVAADQARPQGDSMAPIHTLTHSLRMAAVAVEPAELPRRVDQGADRRIIGRLEPRQTGRGTLAAWACLAAGPAAAVVAQEQMGRILPGFPARQAEAMVEQVLYQSFLGH